MPRIALVHALAASVAPIEAELSRLWPEARRMNLLDDSLAGDLAAGGQLDAAMTERFLALAAYARGTGADALLFTCSAFGPCIGAVKAAHPGWPVLAPNEAMVDEALAAAQAGGCAIGLVASFAPTLASMPAEFSAVDAGVSLHTALADGALAALQAGDPARHDAAVVAAARRLVQDHGCGVVALAQFSLARAAGSVRDALGPGVAVFTTPTSAANRLRVRVAMSNG
ncbi:MAG: aspartate/glutamate racemase family protein [Rubrivivax sp.]|nr:aspartate/glutamate racemase family protein [Rubrivivax sp.]